MPHNIDPASPQMSCQGCQHFYVTHQPAWPYGCRAFGMRSRQHPARDVLVNSGKPCRMRQAQPVKEFSLEDVRS